jgi:hypothetical protein
MSRDSDWHVFDKACEITAMAVRGTASGDGVKPAYVADVFKEVHRALQDVAHAMENPDSKAGF